MNYPLYKADCLYFNGEIPCTPHKLHGVHCADCQYYTQSQGRILIVKLGAIGDVIRTTPLLSRLRKEFPGYELWWVTQSPDVLPSSLHKILACDALSLEIIRATTFSLVINLDKAPEACAIASSVQADKKWGFVLHNGKPEPVNNTALHKFSTGIFDDISQKNTKSYLSEIFEICGWEFQGEEYELPIRHLSTTLNRTKMLVGLNTGCGARWTSRLWDTEQWIALTQKLIDNSYEIILLGGPQEDERNKEIAQRTGAEYNGYVPMHQFIDIVDQCDIIVTGVTMALHIAIGLKKQIVVMNNIFNKHEFELYGRGEIIEPSTQCTCYYKSVCVNPDYRCMEHLSVDSIFHSIQRRSLSLQNQ